MNRAGTSEVDVSGERLLSASTSQGLPRHSRSRVRQQRMEPLWSPVVATGGNRSQIALAPNPQDQAKTVAAGCDRLPIGAHGKGGGRRFESVRGLCKSPGKR